MRTEEENEYAKEVAIDFHRWCLNDSLINFLNDQPFQTLIPHPTDEQHFERFLSERNQLPDTIIK